MRVLAHVHTFNDEDVIDRSLQALLAQTFPVAEILLVDNASTDGTLRRVLPQQVTVKRHQRNLGTSGAVVTGFSYAIEHGFDWIWVFDADTAPRANALERLFALYQSFSPQQREQTWRLASLPVDMATQACNHGCRFGWFGVHRLQPPPDGLHYECDGAIWSGSLFKVATLRAMGLPSPDYVLDMGEFAYSYQGKQCGYRMFVNQASVVDHNIGGTPGLSFERHRVGFLEFSFRELSPIRCYYMTRNCLYFGLYVYQKQFLRSAAIVAALRMIKLTGSFLLRFRSRSPQLAACLRGMRDGLSKNMHRRYQDEDPGAHPHLQQ